MRIVYVVTRSDSIGGAHVHVHDLAIAAVEKRMLPAVGVIDKLIRQNEVPRRMKRGDATDRGHGERRVDAAIPQRP